MSGLFAYIHTKTKKRENIPTTWRRSLVTNALKLIVVASTLKFTTCILDQPTYRTKNEEVLARSCI